MLARTWNNLNSHTLLVDVQNGVSILKNRKCLIKLNIYFPYKSENIHLNIYPRGMRIYVRTKTYLLMFTTAFFITTKNWKPK